jgi:hypothetical protein
MGYPHTEPEIVVVDVLLLLLLLLLAATEGRLYIHYFVN